MFFLFWKILKSDVYIWKMFSDGKESACNARDLGSIPGSGRSPGEMNGNPLQYFCLENPMDRGGGRLQSVESDWMTNTHLSESEINLKLSEKSQSTVQKTSFSQPFETKLLTWYPILPQNCICYKDILPHIAIKPSKWL